MLGSSTISHGQNYAIGNKCDITSIVKLRVALSRTGQCEGFQPMYGTSVRSAFHRGLG